jgi:hypothetical protein
MGLDRLYRKAVRIDLAYPTAFAAPLAPIAAELNNATFVKNITAALDEDNTEFTLGDPDTDDSMSFTDDSGNSTPTLDNPTVTMTAYMDDDRSASGVYDLATQLLAFPDEAFYAIMRVGYAPDAAYAVGQEIRLVGVTTDLPVYMLESGSNAKIQNNFLTSGLVVWNYTIAG